MDDKEFRKRVKRLAKKLGLEYREVRQGKGSHEGLFLGNKRTTIKKGEIGAGLLSEMCRQLGIHKKDL